MESIRWNFFNGIDGSERKLAMISWNKVLASKKYGGLGSSLWARFIKAIYGERCAIDSFEPISRRSLWLDIVRKTKSLKNKGIDLLAFVRKKVGNGEDTLFWNDIWLDEMALKHRYPRLYALELSKHISISDKLSNESLVFSYRRTPRDRWSLSYEASGEFSVKSVRSFIDYSLLPKEDVPTRWWELEDIVLDSYEDWLQWFNNVRLSKRIKKMFEGANYVMW
ncbi:hypothetical protein Tco_0979485 [Tanacetum coccineum]